MEGIKRKVIIAILLVLAIALGYQACTMAVGEKYSAGNPPYYTGQYIVFCREHYNDFYFGNTGKYGSTYVCKAEYDTESNGAYGFAYFLSRASNGTIQRWFWDHSGTANGQYILNAGTDFEEYFTGFMSNLGLEEAFSDATLGDSSEENKFEPQPIINFWNDPTINIIDSVPYEFFEKVNQNEPSDPESKEIKDITYEDYNYAYQLTFLFNHMNNNLKNSNKKLTVSDLEKHISAYSSDTIGSVVMHADTKNNKGCMITQGVKKDVVIKNTYGQSIRLWECEAANGQVTYWALDEDRYNGDKSTYNTIYMIEGWHTDANNQFVQSSSLPNTAKFNKDTLTIGNKISLQDYINIFYNKDITTLKTKLDANGHKALAKLLPDKVSSSEELLSVFNGIYVKYRTMAYNKAVNSEEEINEPSKIEMPDSGDDLYFKFSGSVATRAKIYQYLRANNYLEKWANEKFSIDSSNAKMSIDADRNNQKYIIGPFVMHYPTIVLGDETILGLDPDGENKGMSLTLKYNNGSSETTKKLEMNKDFTLIRGNECNTLVRKDGSKIEVPKSGDEFYIELNKDVKGKGNLLDKEDKLTLNADFKYLKTVKAVVHFLQAEGDNDATSIYSTSHPQRFIAILAAKKDAFDNWQKVSTKVEITPSYIDLKLTKVDENNQEVAGATFKALAVYQTSNGTKKYFSLASQSGKANEFSVLDSNNEYSVLDNENVPKYYTKKSEDDKKVDPIVISDVPEQIVYKDSKGKITEVYTFQKAIAKEIEAPNGYALDDTPFDIDKNSGYEHKHVNHSIKPYTIKIRKVDEEGNPVPNLQLKMYNLDLSKENTSEDEKNVQTLKTDQINPKYPTSGGYATYNGKLYSDKIALVIEEQLTDAQKTDYEYFKKVVLIYSTIIDKNGNVSLKFLNSEEAGNFYTYEDIKPGIEFKNGKYLLVTETGDTVYGTDTEEYLKTGESGTDVTLINHKSKEYHLNIKKVDEFGNTSSYLNGTRFNIVIAKNGKEVFATKQPIIVSNGVARLSEGLSIYGDKLSLYLQEIPNAGFKTEMKDKTLIFNYSASKDGKIVIDENSINRAVINPENLNMENELVEYNGDSMTINLTAINESEDYTLKFRKTDDEGKPLIGATFTLMDKPPATAGSSLATRKEDTSKAPDGYMEFSGFRASENEQDFVTLYLFESAPAAGYNNYTSNATEADPVVIRYVYIPGSGKLQHLSIIHRDKTIAEDIELKMSEAKDDEGKIVFNFGELNEIFTLVNKPNPYDLDLFTKKDEEGNPISGLHFKVSIYKTDKDGNTVYAKYKINKEDEDDQAIEIKDIEVVSQGDGEGEVKGRVVIPNVIDYGTYNVRIQELPDENGEYKLIDDIMTLTFTKNKGDEEDNKPIWGDKLVVTSKVKDEDGNDKTINTEYTKTATSTQFVDKNGKVYKYITIDPNTNKLDITNYKVPYTLVIKKINGLSKDAMKDVSFTAEICNNGEGNEHKHATHSGKTTEKGEIIIKDIDIYSTEKNPNITVKITEKVPAGYSGSEYENIWFEITYQKYKVNDNLANVSYSDVYANLGKDKDGNLLGDKVISKGDIMSITETPYTDEANGKVNAHDIVVPNMPTFDLPIFYKHEDINGNEIPIKEGVTFTAKVKDSNGEILKDYAGNEIEFNCVLSSKDGLVTVKGIDVGRLFIDENGNLKEGPQALSLVVKENVYEIYQELEDITINFNCEYKKESETYKWVTDITKYTYQGESIDVTALNADSKEVKQFAGQSLYVKMEDEDGKLKPAAYVLNKKKEEVAPIAIKKVDENGNTVAGIEFVGKIYKADDNNVFVAFDTTTNDNGIASINMSKDDAKKLLGDAKTVSIKLVIEEEKWSSENAKKAWQEKAGMPDGDLEFIKNVTITGLSIDETETETTINRMIQGFDKAKSDNDKVTINKTTLEVVVENDIVDYPLHIIKTTEALTDNENAERLTNIPFDIKITKGENDSNPQQFDDIKTGDKGEINLSGIRKFGDDLTLTLKEKISQNTGIKILSGEVYIKYSATINADKTVKIEIKEISYEKAEDEGKVQAVPNENGELTFNVINPKDYSITLKKKIRVNQNEGTSDSTVPVKFKGFITTDRDKAYNVNSEKDEKTILSYDEFNAYVEQHKAEASEDTIFFEDFTKANANGEQELPINSLKFYDKQVYVYFIETDVPNNMETIKEVMWASFNKKSTNFESKGVSDATKVSVNSKDVLNIEVTAINNIIPYKVNLIKIDSSTNKAITSFDGAIFNIKLKVLNDDNSLETNSEDTATVVFTDDGTIDEKQSVVGNKYILGMNLVEEENGDKYIQLDINKFGHLVFEIEEKQPPKGYKALDTIATVEYTIYPQTEEGNIYVDKDSIKATPEDIINAEAMVASEADSTNAGNLLSININLKNNPEDYTIPVKKVIKNEDGSLGKSSDTNGIQFEVNFFDLNGNRILANVQRRYVVENGEFNTAKIDEFNKYYMTLEEKEVNNKVIKLEGIHVFEITPNNNIKNKIEKIEYKGTGIINDNKITLTGDMSKKDMFETEEDGVSMLFATNTPIPPYTIDFTKVDPDGNELKGAEFTVILQKVDDKFETLGEPVFNKEGLITDDYGMISIENVREIGTYKLTIIETNPPYGMKKTFDKIEIIYKTADCKEINILDANAWLNGTELSDKDKDEILKYDDSELSKGHVSLTLENDWKREVSLNIHKEYYDKDNNLKTIAIPNVIFKGYVTEIETGYTKPFTSDPTDSNGNVNIGKYRMEGEVEVTIIEESTPSGFDKIPKTSVKINVENGQIDLSDYSSTTNTLAEITDDNELVIVNTQTYEPKISFDGFVWEEIPKRNFKEEDEYVDKGWYNENIDSLIPTVNNENKVVTGTIENTGNMNYETEINTLRSKIKSGVIVTLWDENNKWVKITQTDEMGGYLFDQLNPFTKYYITFELVNANKGINNTEINTGRYDGYNYESVNYLVQQPNGESYTGKIQDVVGNDAWSKNSKAVMDGENSDTATTTASATPKDKQLYPLYDQFTVGYITDEGEEITLYINNQQHKYYTEQQVGTSAVDFKPLSPSNNWINLGIIRKKKFNLSLEKDVKDITIWLDNESSQQYDFGMKDELESKTGSEQGGIYKLKINEADRDRINNMEIVYTIRVKNANIEIANLESIADYYNSDILEFAGWSIGSETHNASEAKVEQVDSMIPIQIRQGGTFTKNGKANTSRAIIPVQRQIKMGDSEAVNIEVKYKYTQSFINTLKTYNVKDEYITLGLAEIFDDASSKTGKFDDNSYAGNLLDKFKANPDYKTFYEDYGDDFYITDFSEATLQGEDDEDLAPAVKVIISDGDVRTISGTVFEDKNSSGEFDNGDKTIQGIQVALMEEGKAEAVETETTDKNGNYTFKSMPAGTYHLEFTYGDENTILPLTGTELDNQVVNIADAAGNNKEYRRLNDTSYNTLEFEDLCTDEVEFNNSHSNEYWYALDNAKHSDAKDDQVGRLNADKLVNESPTGNPAETSKIMNNRKAERLYSYKGNVSEESVQKYINDIANVAVTAKTNPFKVNIENTVGGALQYNELENGDVTYYYKGTEDMVPAESLTKNIDFGVKARPQSDISITKEVENIKIFGSAGNSNVDASYNEETQSAEGTAPRVQWTRGINGNDGYIWIQRSDEEITGAELEITYKITVKNSADEAIKVVVADYVQEGMQFAQVNNKENNWDIATATTTEENGSVIASEHCGNIIINNNIDLKNISTIAIQNVEVAGKSDKELRITLTKRLNSYSQADIDAYTNYVEIIQTEATGDLARKDVDSIPGDFDPNQNTTISGNLGQIVTTVDGIIGLEKDSAKAIETVSITAETGENRNTTYYILAFSAIAVLATGVGVIIDKVIKRK